MIKSELGDSKFQKRLLLFNSALPAAFLLWDGWQGNLGANPIEAFIRSTGVLTLIFLALTLSVTPLAQLMKWSWLIKHRRAIGLISFAYGLLHFLSYVIFDRGADLSSVPADIAKRPFILVGFGALMLMVPLAITSTNIMIKRLGPKRWRALHKLTYPIAVAGVVHYWMIVKSDITAPLGFAIVIGALLATRLGLRSARKQPRRA